MTNTKSKRKIREFLGAVKKNGGQVRMAEALSMGINRYMLYNLRDRGVLEQIARGVYRLYSLPQISRPDLVAVALRAPEAVICLLSALDFHGLTDAVPHTVSIAVKCGSNRPRISYPPVSAHFFSPSAYSAGIVVHNIDGIMVRIYSPEKTLADCFKFRNKIGMDIFLEAVKRYRSQRNANVKELLKYARICRVEKAMTPYLESIL